MIYNPCELNHIAMTLNHFSNKLSVEILLFQTPVVPYSVVYVRVSFISACVVADG